MILKKYLEYYHRLKASKYKPVLDVALFSIITVFLHWFYYSRFNFAVHTEFFQQTANLMATRVFEGAVWFNRHILRLDMIIDWPSNTLILENIGYITVNEGCSGFKQDYQLLGLFLLYPGLWKHKLWFIPMTFVVMHFTNIFRIVVLTIILRYMPEHWDFWHEWIMRPFYYVVIFALWLFWNKSRFSGNPTGMSPATA